MEKPKIVDNFAVFEALIENTNTSLRVIVKDVELEELNENGVWLKGRIGKKKLLKHITINTLKLLLVSEQIV